MLKNVKSYFFIHRIFSHMEESQKLIIIKYNKSLQKILNISIANYKHFTGRYMIYDSKRIVKEYNGEDDELIFEGEYLNGKRNGKGKEYFGKINKLRFEGECLNDKKWNGKGYDWNGIIIYEVINGNGKVEEYYDNGILRFDGEYLSGARNGKGKEYDEGNGLLRFEGEYLNGKRNGKGKEYYWNNGKLLFEGEYLYNYKLKGKYYIKNYFEY